MNALTKALKRPGSIILTPCFQTVKSCCHELNRNYNVLIVNPSISSFLTYCTKEFELISPLSNIWMLKDLLIKQIMAGVTIIFNEIYYISPDLEVMLQSLIDYISYESMFDGLSRTASIVFIGSSDERFSNRDRPLYGRITDYIRLE